MKQQYITPSSQSVNLYVEDALMETSFRVSTQKQSDVSFSQEKQWEGSGIWGNNLDNE